MQFIDIAALTIHDVKNRLALLASRAEARGDADTLCGLLDAATRLSGLLACYKAEAGQLPVEIDARSPGDLLTELAAEARRMTSLPLVLHAEAAPAIGFYDENLVRLVLMHAIHNALRHARQGIGIDAFQEDGWLVFRVRDDGPGYPDTLLAEPRTPMPLSREGTGVGLQLAARVAALHTLPARTGHLVLRNAGGAVFELKLPA